MISSGTRSATGATWQHRPFPVKPAVGNRRPRQRCDPAVRRHPSPACRPRCRDRRPHRRRERPETPGGPLSGPFGPDLQSLSERSWL